MIAVTYKKNLKKGGVLYLPFQDYAIANAKKQADILYKQGYLNVKVVKMEEEILYIPDGR